MFNISYLIEKIIHLFEQKQKTHNLIKILFSRTPRNFLTVIRNPIKVSDLELKQIEGFKDVGVLFQGPIDKNNDFTVETIKLIRLIYPDIQISLSTWKGSLSEESVKQLENFNCLVIQSDSFPAADKGTNKKKSYLKNQLYSTQVGVSVLKQNGCKYILKIRTDIRIYKRDFIPYFINILKTYRNNNIRLTNRLICVGFSNNLINVPFHMSDFIWFGFVDDIEKFYRTAYWTEFRL